MAEEALSEVIKLFEDDFVVVLIVVVQVIKLLVWKPSEKVEIEVMKLGLVELAVVFVVFGIYSVAVEQVMVLLVMDYGLLEQIDFGCFVVFVVEQAAVEVFVVVGELAEELVELAAVQEEFVDSVVMELELAVVEDLVASLQVLA